MTTYLGNAFSLNMLQIEAEGLSAEIQPVIPSEIPADAVCIIGHADVASLASGILAREVTVNRQSVALQAGDILYVIQYRGARLPAGTNSLPANASLEFYRVTFRTGRAEPGQERK